MLSPDGQNPPSNPSENSALDFKGEFPRFEFCAVSTTIAIDRSIFEISGKSGVIGFAKYGFL
jgi:hypothetical protein